MAKTSLGNGGEMGRRMSNPDAALEKMGYKSELPRSLSMMSILGLLVIANPGTNQ
jgi:hypothetical protein